MAKTPQKAIVHEKISMKLYQGEKSMTVDDAKKLIGWATEASTGLIFGDDFDFRDQEGNKIKLGNNSNNRPFRKSLALLYSNEILRNKWALNGEPIIIDCRNDVQSGQHRLIGLILAEQLRKKNPKTWGDYGTRGVCTIETIVVVGISDKPETVDTIDLGQKRSLGDVIFRDRRFLKADKGEQKQLANVLAGAARVVWLCMGGLKVSDAPKFMHSEALDLIQDHPRLLDAVGHVFTEDAGAEKQIRKCLSLGYAAGMLYLMGMCKTDTVEYDEKGTLDDSMWDKAEEFFTLLASGADLEKGNAVLVLRNYLVGKSASGAEERDEIVAAVKIAWNAWVEGKKLDGAKDMKAPRLKDGDDKGAVDMPYMGGLDVFREDEGRKARDAEKAAQAEAKAKAKADKEVAKAKVKEEKEKTAAKEAEKKAKEKEKADKVAAKGGKAPPAAKSPPIAVPVVKAPPKKGAKKNVSYPFTVGDHVHAVPAGKPEEAYEGEVTSIATDGKVQIKVVVDGKEYACVVNPAEGDYVGKEPMPIAG